MPSVPLECYTETRSGALVMHVGGEIDLWTAEALRLKIDPVVRSGSPVVVDLREVSYLDGALDLLGTRRQSEAFSTPKSPRFR